MGERSTILFINLLKIVSLLCERLILKLYSAKYWSMLNSDTQEYIPLIQDFTWCITLCNVGKFFPLLLSLF